MRVELSLFNHKIEPFSIPVNHARRRVFSTTKLSHYFFSYCESWEGIWTFSVTRVCGTIRFTNCKRESCRNSAPWNLSVNRRVMLLWAIKKLHIYGYIVGGRRLVCPCKCEVEDCDPISQTRRRADDVPRSVINSCPRKALLKCKTDPYKFWNWEFAPSARVVLARQSKLLLFQLCSESDKPQS